MAKRAKTKSKNATKITLIDRGDWIVVQSPGEIPPEHGLQLNAVLEATGRQLPYRDFRRDNHIGAWLLKACWLEYLQTAIAAVPDLKLKFSTS